MFYDGLPSTTPKCEFKGIQDCLQIVEQQEGESQQDVDFFDQYFIFTIDERSFLDCFLTSDESLLTKSWESYNPSTHHLIIKIESKVHAVATTHFTIMFNKWMQKDMENYPVDITNTMTVRGPESRRRADCSWTPDHAGLDRTWPSVVLEVAWSQSRAKLENAIKFWLREGGGQVRVVLSLTVHRRGRIILEKWGLRGADATPFPIQKMEIVRDPAPKCKKIEGHVDVSFEDARLRPKQRGDEDFVFTADHIEWLAEQIWRVQMSGPNLHNALLRPPIIQILRAQGFHSTRPSVLESIQDLTGRYLIILASAAAEHSANAHPYDPVPDLEDIYQALQDAGAIRPQLREWEEEWQGEEDMRGLEAFLSWITGPAHREIRRVAGFLPSEGDMVDPDAVEKEDYLTALKKKHSKTGEESRYAGTVLGKSAEEHPVTIEGGAPSIQDWGAQVRARALEAMDSDSSGVSSAPSHLSDDEAMGA
ncbi:unnamed protein product [Penicillium glandicola]